MSEKIDESEKAMLQELFSIAVFFMVINNPDLIEIINDQRMKARRGLQ